MVTRIRSPKRMLSVGYALLVVSFTGIALVRASTPHSVIVAFMALGGIRSDGDAHPVAEKNALRRLCASSGVFHRDRTGACLHPAQRDRRVHGARRHPIGW